MTITILVGLVEYLFNDPSVFWDLAARSLFCTATIAARHYQDLFSTRSLQRFPGPPLVFAMDIKSQQSKERDGVLSSLNTAIEVLNLAKELSCISSAASAFGSVSALLTIIRVHPRLFCKGVLRAHNHPGLHDQPTGLCGARVILRRYL